MDRRCVSDVAHLLPLVKLNSTILDKFRLYKPPKFAQQVKKKYVIKIKSNTIFPRTPKKFAAEFRQVNTSNVRNHCRLRLNVFELAP